MRRRAGGYEIIADSVTTGAVQRGLPQGGTAGTRRDQLEVIRRAQSRLDLRGYLPEALHSLGVT